MDDDAIGAGQRVRRAGRAALVDGSVVTWSVAEGTKGRRWREVAVRGGAIVHSLLLETFPDGRFAHVELSMPAGLLTLHPEADGTLHGNAVTTEGVRHVRGLPWSDASVVLIEGSIVAEAAAAALGAVAESGIRVRRDLALDPVTSRRTPCLLDADGLPILEGGESWPLEEPD